jgi:predicted MFS family arabinose efflux permease
VNAARAPWAERRLILLLAAVQFVNILDFMIVMPLGPAFASSLGIPTSHLGVIGGSYVAAAAVSGLVAAAFLDRLDRRKALVVALAGLVLGTAAAGLAHGFPALVAARVWAGLFGGPATSLALAILTDVVPPERRGRAMGTLMGAFAAASVLGVPAGLRLSVLGGWRLPFIAVAALGALVVVGTLVLMAPMPASARLARGPAGLAARPVRLFLGDGLVRLTYLGMAAAYLGSFAVIPNLATFLQYNLGYPGDQLDRLYLAGGVVSFFAMRAAGAVVDRRGPMPVVVFGNVLLVALLAGCFVPAHTPVPVTVLFVGFMLANSTRMVGLNTQSSKIPSAAERARFMSGQSVVQHLAAALGAGLSSLLLVERPDHSLGRVDLLAWVAIALTLLVPFVVAAIQRRLPVAAGSLSRASAR